jgi:hypothetical protein
VGFIFLDYNFLIRAATQQRHTLSDTQVGLSRDIVSNTESSRLSLLIENTKNKEHHRTLNRHMDGELELIGRKSGINIRRCIATTVRLRATSMFYREELLFFSTFFF